MKNRAIQFLTVVGAVAAMAWPEAPLSRASSTFGFVSTEAGRA